MQGSARLLMRINVRPTGGSMDYTLEPLTIGCKAIVPLSKDEYESIRSAKSSLAMALALEEKFDLLVENYMELEQSLVGTGIRRMIVAGWDYRQIQIERGLFNRRLVNLLTAARTYVDHSPQHINDLRAAGCCDEQYSIDEAFAAQYDSRLGYRVMSAVRNYVQHCGFPLHVFNYNVKRLDRSDGPLFRHTIELYVSAEQLEADGKFKRSVLEELRADGERADLMELAATILRACGLRTSQPELRFERKLLNARRSSRKLSAVLQPLLNETTSSISARPQGTTAGWWSRSKCSWTASSTASTWSERTCHWTICQGGS